jgi:hypothetical protein
MKYLILFLAIICGIASFVFSDAAEEAASGEYWAAQVCTTAEILCEKPMSLALAAATLMALWITLTVTSSFSN